MNIRQKQVLAYAKLTFCKFVYSLDFSEKQRQDAEDVMIEVVEEN